MAQLGTTPRDTLFRDGTASLLRFRRPAGAEEAAALPVLLVPSLINRWYVLDLRPGGSLVEALVARGLDVWCVDWGVPQDEDRYLSWQDVLDRLGRMVRRVRRETGADRVGVLGYCMGATLSGIWAALHPEQVAAFINLAGPFDFSEAGRLAVQTDPRWFDADAIAAAGNVTPEQMQAGFTALRPTAQLAKAVGYVDRLHDPDKRAAFEALEAWASDTVPFPAAAYATYIGSLYQGNELVRGEHRVAGRAVDLGAIRCPLLTIVASRDTICPPPAALGLDRAAGSADKQVLSVPGGHVGAVVGGRASRDLYPAIGQWLVERLASRAAAAQPPGAATAAPA